MDFILISDPSKAAIDAGLLARIRDTILKYSAGTGQPKILSEHVAYEFVCTPHSIEGMDFFIALHLARSDLEVDLSLLPSEPRRKKLLVADMDSTIIEQECIDELADFAGKREEIAAITERAMKGELDFEAALLERVAMLEGLPESVLQETFEKKITLTPGARTLVQTMKKFGARTALVSGGFTFFTERVAHAAGFDFHEANELIIKNGRLTGEVKLPIKGRAAKKEALERHASELGVSLDATMAAGDGANDLAMLAAAAAGVAFHAKPAVAKAAKFRINHGDLTALLYLQGIAQSEFAN